ncbi:hypothetical protein Tco_0449101 [Tanacetum coccineum]
MKYHRQTHIPLRPNLGVLQIGIKSQDLVMSDSEDSTVTYTAAPPSLDYVLGSKEPKQALPLLEFVPEPVYPEFMPLEDDVLPAEEQPLLAAVLPIANSPRYILESDPEEDDDEDPEEDPADYPTDREDEEEEEPFEDEADDKDEDEDNEEEEEEHPALTDSVPPLVHQEVERFLTIPTPPPSPLTPLSSPLPHIPSPPLPVSPPLPASSPPPPASPTYPLGFRIAMIRLRAETPSTSHLLPSSTPPSGTPPFLPISLPTPSPPLILPSTDHRADRPEVCLPPRKRLCIALGPRYEVGRASSAPTELRPLEDEMLVGMLGAPTTDDTELGRRMTEFATMVRQDTYEIYGRLDEAQYARAVLSGRLNLLQTDRRFHAYTALLMKRETRLSREAWGRSMDASDTTRSEVRALRTTVLAQQAEIGALRAADRTRQAQLMETLTLLRTLQT